MPEELCLYVAHTNINTNTKKIDIYISYILILMTNYRKGIEYEIFINDYLNSLDSTRISYLWKNIPDKVLFDADLITDFNIHRLDRGTTKNTLHDFGIDIVLLTKDDKINFVQCKNYKRNIKVNDIAGFSYVMANKKHMDKMAYLYYTSNPSKNLIENKPDNFVFCKREFTKCVPHKKQYKLYEYQKKAVVLFDKYYNGTNRQINNKNGSDDKNIHTNNKAILVMPCGTGKTIMSCHISISYNVVVLITPLKQYAEQNIDKYRMYDPTRKSLLIDTDGTREIKIIKMFIKNNDRILLSVTYKSCDVINRLNLNNPFIIIDEFHNLSRNNVYNEDDEINKIINSDNKILYMSATPRIYELEDDDDDYIESMFGTTVYKMEYKEAIEKGYICDYEVIMPGISESKNNIDEISMELCNKSNIKLNEDNSLFQKCCYLYECIKRYGCMKCILYFRNIREIKEFMEMFNMMNKYYKYDYVMDDVNHNNCKKIRTKKLNKFNRTSKMYFMCSVGILDEAIDIPTCDTIYITYECTSPVRCVQRISRCLRKGNPGKKGRVILWCDEMSKCFAIMSAIKEMDIDFNKKVKLISINNGIHANIEKKDNELMKSNLKSIMKIRDYWELMWEKKLNDVKKFISEKKRRPSSHSKNMEEKKMGSWIDNQQSKYRKKKGIMESCDFYDKWKKFADENLFDEVAHWYDIFNEVKQFVCKNNKYPTRRVDDKCEKAKGEWIHRQQQNYKKRKGLMRCSNIYDEWTEFIREYTPHIPCLIVRWYNMLNKSKKFMNRYQKKPSTKNPKYKNEKTIYEWFHTQRYNYRNRKCAMAYGNIRNEWFKFTKKYGLTI